MNTSECTKIRAECIGSIVFRTTALARRIWQKWGGTNKGGDAEDY